MNLDNCHKFQNISYTFSPKDLKYGLYIFPILSPSVIILRLLVHMA